MQRDPLPISLPGPVAYLINQYPKVSHSFIRREIRALEQQGIAVLRIALRGWDEPLPDPEDRAERPLTRYVLRGGLLPLLADVIHTALHRPFSLWRALRQACAMARGADRPWPYHLFYLAEGCRILRWLQQAGACHLHAHFGTNPAEVALLVRALGGPPYSVTVHGSEEFDKPGPLHLGRKLEQANFVVAISSYARSQLFRVLPHAQWPKVQQIHCGIDSAFYAGPPAPLPLAPRLVCVGRFCEQKGQLLLLDAMHLLAQRAVHVELVLAGDGDMRAELENLIACYGLGRKVRITGWIDSAGVRAEIEQARALVVSSFAEGLPVVIMEAMALSRPVISTAIAGIPELLATPACGWLLPPGDLNALADAMAEASCAPLSRLESMGAAARARVRERHAIEVEAGKLVRQFLAQTQHQQGSP